MRSLLFILFLFIAATANAQNYQLVWEENFDGNSLDSSKWNVEQKIGVWNTGSNREFQHYRKENITVGDDGEGRNCLIITAKKEEYNGYHYTSGRINTKGKFSFKRGKLEASIKVPNLANGLWPAFWTLGYTPVGWPDCGEIDILEMGHAAGISAGKQNSFIGSHLFWGPYPRDYGRDYTAPQDLSQGFYKHTLVWTETRISVYFNDSPTPYFEMGISGADAEEFRDFQHYIILNLAVGGSVPGIFNQSGITANFPANMYVDWVKLYQVSEDINENEEPLFGQVGIFEDKAGVDMRMDLGYDLLPVVSGLAEKNDETPKDGNRVLSYNTQAGQDFSLKLTSGIKRNMSRYNKGSVQFYLKTNLTTGFQIGVADTSGNEAFVSIGQGSDQLIAADNNWQLAYIPLEQVSENVDLSALKDMLIVKGDAVSAGYLSIDEVIFSETAPTGGVFGIYTNNPSITEKFVINNVTANLYNWDNTVAFNSAIPAYEGQEVLSFRSQGGAGWWGFGFFSSNPLNFENFASGYLHFSLRTKSKELFRVNINGANDSKGEITFANGNDPYGFVRDGKWHQIVVPMSALVAQGLNLSACGNIFTMSGGTITDLAVDDVYLSNSEDPAPNTAICQAVSLTVSPKNTTGKTGVRKKFNASAKNQFDKPIDATVTWESNGGTIEQDGYFTASEPGVYTIIARMGSLSDSATITVESANERNDLNNEIIVSYLRHSKTVMIKGLEQGSQIQLFNLTGALVYTTETNLPQAEIKLGNHSCPAYILKVANGEKHKIVKFIAQ